MAEQVPDRDGVRSVIARLCADIAREPLLYFSEADVQSMAFAALLQKYPDLYETDYQRGPGSSGRYRTTIAHREYGMGGHRRIDIAVFTPDQIKQMDSPNLESKDEGYIPPTFGIEFGTEKTTDTAEHLDRDIEKLSMCLDRGYLLHIYRDVTVADTGTRTRSKTEDKLLAEFMKPVEQTSLPHKVKAIFMLVRVARSHKKIFGKCQVYSPDEEDKWPKVNLNDVEDVVLERLR